MHEIVEEYGHTTKHIMTINYVGDENAQTFQDKLMSG